MWIINGHKRKGRQKMWLIPSAATSCHQYQPQITQSQWLSAKLPELTCPIIRKSISKGETFFPFSLLHFLSVTFCSFHLFGLCFHSFLIHFSFGNIIFRAFFLYQYNPAFLLPSSPWQLLSFHSPQGCFFFSYETIFNCGSRNQTAML